MEQYTLIPAYRDTYYEYSGDSLSFFIQVDGNEVVFQGNAVKGPNEDSIRININRIAKDYLSQSMPDFRDADGTILRHPEAFRIFRLYRNDGILLRSYGVLFDWEGEFGGEYPGEIPMSLTKILSDPIKPNVSADMILPITVFGGFSGGTIDGGGDCPACNGCSQLDGFDGRYLFFRGTGNFINNSGITAYTADEEYSTTAVTAAPAEFPSAYSYNLPSDPEKIFFMERGGVMLTVVGGDRLIFPESVKVLSGDTYGGHISNYGEIGGRGIETITNVYFFHTNVKKVWFPSLKKVAGLSFSGCTQLNEVCLPSAEVIGGDCFLGCTSLTEIDLPSCYEVGGYAFSGCTKLERAHITFNGMQYSDGGVFQGDIVGGFGGYAFSSCPKLKSVTFDNLLCYRNQLTFNPLLEEVNMPRVEAIIAEGGGYLHPQPGRYHTGFYGCDSLERLSLPSLVKIVGEAFNNMASLEELHLPYLRTICGGARASDWWSTSCYPTFYNLPNLHTIDLPNLRQLYGGVVFGPNIVLENNEITLPNLEYIGSLSEYYDPEVWPSTSGYTPESETFDPELWAASGVSTWAFSGSVIKTLHLPKIKAIMGNAFSVQYASYSYPNHIYVGKSLRVLDPDVFSDSNYGPMSGATFEYEGTKDEWITNVIINPDKMNRPACGMDADPDDLGCWNFNKVVVNCSDGTLYFKAWSVYVPYRYELRFWGYEDENGNRTEMQRWELPL